MYIAWDSWSSGISVFSITFQVTLWWWPSYSTSAFKSFRTNQFHFHEQPMEQTMFSSCNCTPIPLLQTSSKAFLKNKSQSSLASVNVTYCRHRILKYIVKKIRFYIVLWETWVKAQTVQSKPRCPLISLVSYEFFILYCPVSEACFQTSLVISKTDQVFYCLISLWTHSNSYLLEKIFCLSSSMCAKAYPSGIPEGNSVW